MTTTVGRTTGAEARLPGESCDPAFGGARELQRRVAAPRPRDTRDTCSRSTASRASSTRSATRSTAIASRCSTSSSRTSSASSTARRNTRCCNGSRDGARVRPSPRAVPPPDRGQPPRPDARANTRTFDELVEYCDLSANPVGELVLHVFGAATPERIQLSDLVCTALQLVEHWQDVGEDFGRGRIYLPGGGPASASASSAPTSARNRRAPPFRRLLAFEVERARAAARRRRAARRALSRPRPDRGRRLRRRRTRRARRDRGRGLRRAPRRTARERAVDGSRQTLASAPRLVSVRPTAYAECRRIARDSGSSFYAGMRLLPADRRDAIFAVYALARRIDDIADGGLSTPDEKLAELARVRAELDHLRADSSDPVLAAVADAARRYPIPLAAFGDLVDGAEMDARGTRLRHVRRHRAVRPARRGIDRPPRARRLRDDRSRARRATGGRARRRAPADEHPPRHQRGRAHRARVPAGRGPAAASAVSVDGRTHRGTRGAARRVRGAARARPARAAA